MAQCIVKQIEEENKNSVELPATIEGRSNNKEE